jgi:hypothetical protein
MLLPKHLNLEISEKVINRKAFTVFWCSRIDSNTKILQSEDYLSNFLPNMHLIRTKLLKGMLLSNFNFFQIYSFIIITPPLCIAKAVFYAFANIWRRLQVFSSEIFMKYSKFECCLDSFSFTVDKWSSTNPGMIPKHQRQRTPGPSAPSRPCSRSRPARPPTATSTRTSPKPSRRCPRRSLATITRRTSTHLLPTSTTQYVIF